MKKMVMLVLVVLSAGLARMGAQTSGGAFVARLDPALDEIISADAKLETVRSDFGNAEGPNWIQQGKSGYLVFTDIAANVIYKMTPDGKASVLVDHAGYTGLDPWNVGGDRTNDGIEDPRYRFYFQFGADGLTLDKEGRIIVAGSTAVPCIASKGTASAPSSRRRTKESDSPVPTTLLSREMGRSTSRKRVAVWRVGATIPMNRCPRKGNLSDQGRQGDAVCQRRSPTNGLAFSPDEKTLT